MKDLDRMAMAAMQGMLSGGAYFMGSNDKRIVIKNAYDIAEAMLEESKKRSNEEPIEID